MKKSKFTEQQIAFTLQQADGLTPFRTDCAKDVGPLGALIVQWAISITRRYTSSVLPQHI